MDLLANAENSGTCGPNLKWLLTDNGVLVITGKGGMYDYSDYNRSPWSKSDIKRIIIGDGVTTIGEFAFNDCIYNHRTTKTNQKYPSVNL
mgnify:CR=1 FL=1